MDLYAESQRPYCAKAWTARREWREKQAGAGAEQKIKHFGKLDFTSIVLEKKLRTRAAVMEYTQTYGTEGMQEFVHKNQGNLKVLLEQAEEWGQAAAVAEKERTSDWTLVCQTAEKACPHGPRCRYACAASRFFSEQRHFPRDALATALRAILQNGPTKTTRVPLLVGATNSGKTTLVKPIIKLFGFKNVLHQPALNSKFALRNILQDNKKFIFWDDYRPVD